MSSFKKENQLPCDPSANTVPGLLTVSTEPTTAQKKQNKGQKMYFVSDHMEP